jgi:1-acyl-sn-glycerol-3-phosphate acyltransferase
MKIFAHINWVYTTAIILIGLTIKILFYKLLPRPYGSKIASWFIRLLVFNPVKKIGEIDETAQMYLLNHQSDIDIGVMETTTNRNLAWVAKKELFEVPFFGLAVKLSDDIPIERESKSSLVKLLRDCKNRLDHNRSIVMFPEGTRSSTGVMRKFKPGAKLVADKFKLRVQPVVLINTARYFNIKTKTARPGAITIVFMESFIADKNDKEWLSRLQNEMQAVYDKYAAELKR